MTWRQLLAALAAAVIAVLGGCTDGGYAPQDPIDYPPRPSLPSKPWHPDGDEAFTAIPQRLHPRSDEFISRLAETGGLRINTGSVALKHGGHISGYPLNASGEGDPEWKVLDGWSNFGGGGPRVLWINDGRHPARGPIGERIRIPDGAVIQGWPMIGYSDRKLHVVDPERRTVAEIHHAEHWPNGSIRSHAVAYYSLDIPSWEARGTSAAGQPVAELTLRFDDVMAGWVQRTTMGVTLDASSPEWVWPATGSDGPSTHPNALPMGTILRLRPEAVERLIEAGAGPQAQAVMAIFSGPGIMHVDTGGTTATSLEPDPDWDQDDLAILDGLSVRDFDVWTLDP